MTYKEKLNQLSRTAREKAVKFEEINKHFEQPHDGFQEYSIMDYNNAHSAHADAVNAHGKLIKRIIDNNYSVDDVYTDPV